MLATSSAAAALLLAVPATASAVSSGASASVQCPGCVIIADSPPADAQTLTFNKRRYAWINQQPGEHHWYHVPHVDRPAGDDRVVYVSIEKLAKHCSASGPLLVDLVDADGRLIRTYEVSPPQAGVFVGSDLRGYYLDVRAADDACVLSYGLRYVVVPGVYLIEEEGNDTRADARRLEFGHEEYSTWLHPGDHDWYHVPPPDPEDLPRLRGNQRLFRAVHVSVGRLEDCTASAPLLVELVDAAGRVSRVYQVSPPHDAIFLGSNPHGYYLHLRAAEPGCTVSYGLQAVLAVRQHVPLQTSLAWAEAVCRIEHDKRVRLQGRVRALTRRLGSAQRRSTRRRYIRQLRTARRNLRNARAAERVACANVG